LRVLGACLHLITHDFFIFCYYINFLYFLFTHSYPIINRFWHDYLKYLSVHAWECLFWPLVRDMGKRVSCPAMPNLWHFPCSYRLQPGYTCTTIRPMDMRMLTGMTTLTTSQARLCCPQMYPPGQLPVFPCRLSCLARRLPLLRAHYRDDR